MKRFTLKYHAPPEITEQVLNTIKKQILDLGKLSNVHTITRKEGILFIEMTSDYDLPALKEKLSKTALAPDLEFISAGWGWLVSDTSLDDHGFTKEELEETHRFTHRGLLFHLFIAAVFVLFFTYFSAEANFLCAIYILFYGLLFVLQKTSSIKITGDAFEYKNWLFSRKYTWDEISGLSVKYVWGEVKGSMKKAASSFYLHTTHVDYMLFPVPTGIWMSSAHEDTDRLFKLIKTKANLLVVRETPAGACHYMKHNVEVKPTMFSRLFYHW